MNKVEKMTLNEGHIPLQRVNQMLLDSSLQVNPFQRNKQAFELESNPDLKSGCMFERFLEWT